MQDGQQPLMSGPSNAQGTTQEGQVEVAYMAVAADESGAINPQQNGEAKGRCCGLPCPCTTLDEKCLDAVVGIVIFLNVIIMGIELDYPWEGFKVAEQLMLCVYVVDVLLRMKWAGLRAYVTDRSHMVDLIIVSASIFEVWILPASLRMQRELQHPGGHESEHKHSGSILANMTMTLRSFRLLRAFRLIKLIKFARPLYRIIQSMVTAFHRVCWVLLLICVFLYAYALVFTQLLGRDMLDALSDEDEQLTMLKHRFNTVPRTFFELFRAMCGDVTDFGYLISAEDNAVVPIVYMAFQVSTTWLVLAIFTAEVVDTTITTSNTLDKEEQAMTALHSRSLQRDSFTVTLRKLFHDTIGEDVTQIDIRTLAAFLEDEDNITILEKKLNLSAYLAINAWEAIENDGSAEMNDYIDGLVLASHQSSTHSMLRNWAQMRRMARDHHAMWSELTPSKPESTAYELVNPVATGAGEHGHTGTKGVWADVIQMRSQFTALHGSVQAMQSDVVALRGGHHRSSKDAEDKAKQDARKSQRDLADLSAEVHGTQLGLADVRNEVEALREQFRQSTQVEDLRKEIRFLAEKLDNVACTQDLGGVSQALSGVAQALSGSASASDLNEVRSGLTNVQGEVSGLRSDIASLVKTMRADRAASSGSSPSPKLGSTSPEKRLEILGIASGIRDRMGSRDSADSGGSDRNAGSGAGPDRATSSDAQKPVLPAMPKIDGPMAERLERLRAMSSPAVSPARRIDAMVANQAPRTQSRDDAASVLSRPKKPEEFRSIFTTAPAALSATESHGQQPQ